MEPPVTCILGADVLPWKKVQSQALDPLLYFSYTQEIFNWLIVDPVLFVNAYTILLGVVYDPEFKKPSDLSTLDPVIPSAKLYAPPELDPFNIPVPELPAAWVVWDKPEFQSAPILQPEGKFETAAVDIEEKFWKTELLIPVIDCWATIWINEKHNPMNKTKKRIKLYI